MGIRAKLLIAISLCAVAFIIFSLVTWRTVEKVRVNGPIYHDIVQSKDLVADILPPPLYVIETALSLHFLLDSTDETQFKAMQKQLADNRKAFEERNAVWEKSLPDGELKTELLVHSRELADQFFEMCDKEFLPALLAGHKDEAEKIERTRMRPIFFQHRATIEKAVELANKIQSQHEAESSAALAGGGWLLLAVACVVLSLIAFCAWMMNRLAVNIVGRLGRVVQFASGIAEGNLTQHMPVGNDDEVGHLIQALLNMQDRLIDMVGEITSSVETLSGTSRDLTRAAQQTDAEAGLLGQRAGTVAGAAEETSAATMSMAAMMQQASGNIASVATATEQMSATVGDIASNTARARTISEQATSQTRQVQEQMARLGEAAQGIGQITETINSISAQTHLLALNATIEAARAGSAGKGFAVVANEIKELARQTAEATEDIKARIAGVQSSTGSAITDITQISGVIDEVGEIVGSIAVAIEEQSAVTRDVAGHISQASSGVQTASGSLDQTATASRSIAQEVTEITGIAGTLRDSSSHVGGVSGQLSDLVAQLQKLLSQFRTSGAEAQPGAAATAPPWAPSTPPLSNRKAIQHGQSATIQ